MSLMGRGLNIDGLCGSKKLVRTGSITLVEGVFEGMGSFLGSVEFLG